MIEERAKLSQRIRSELSELARVVNRCEKAWERSKLTSDDLYLDSVAINLAGFYSGFERLFELIANIVDGKLPQGANWHQELLAQMRLPIPKTRPAVLSEDSARLLDNFRKFRHVVHNIYTFTFEPPELAKLMEILNPTFSAVRRELLAFAKFLDQKSREKS